MIFDRFFRNSRPTKPTKAKKAPIYVVAILKDEEKFLDEWLVYHRMIGVSHFILFDNSDEQGLKTFVEPHAAYTTVVDWSPAVAAGAPGTPQISAYTKSLELLSKSCRWVAFIDGDEFIVLRKHKTLQQFLAVFGDAGSVVLNWHVFGHNGHYDDPKGLITTALTKRMQAPSIKTKSISRPEAIEGIPNAHGCAMKLGWRRVDANGKTFGKSLYPGKTDVAHVNHYQCRSFRNWMRRVERGDVSFDKDNVPQSHRWRLDEEECLRRFVQSVAKHGNEVEDTNMRWHRNRILRRMKRLGPRGPSTVR